MTKSQVERFVRKAVIAWQIELDMAGWSIDLRFKELGKHGGDAVMAKVSPDWVYKNATLIVDSAAMVHHEYNKRNIAKTLGHEFFHMKHNIAWQTNRDLLKFIKTLLVKLEEHETADMENTSLTMRSVDHISKL